MKCYIASIHADRRLETLFIGLITARTHADSLCRPHLAVPHEGIGGSIGVARDQIGG